MALHGDLDPYADEAMGLRQRRRQLQENRRGGVSHLELPRGDAGNGPQGSSGDHEEAPLCGWQDLRPRPAGGIHPELRHSTRVNGTVRAAGCEEDTYEWIADSKE